MLTSNHLRTNKSSKHQSPSKLINDYNMEKSISTKEKTNTQLNDVRKKSRKRFYESKEKNEKRVPTETEDLEKVTPIKKGTNLIVGGSMLPGIGQKRIPRNRSVKVRIFLGALTHNMYD